MIALIVSGCNNYVQPPTWLEDKGTMEANVKLIICVSQKLSVCEKLNHEHSNDCINKIVNKCGGHIVLRVYK